MSIQKKSLISTLKTTKKANVAKESISAPEVHGTTQGSMRPGVAVASMRGAAHGTLKGAEHGFLKASAKGSFKGSAKGSFKGSAKGSFKNSMKGVQ